MNTLVAKKIKKLRNQKKLSQEQVADYLHISQPTYARIENGESNSWANYILPICDLFEIQPEDLLKQESIIVNQNQQGGNGAFIINQLSEKLIKQYEERIAEYKERLKEKDLLNVTLNEKLENLSLKE
ncbi:MAG: helix-turn-helix transcriptional regulator [Flavobacteriaceae bacterium]|nr:helix-turn-helix transcriptional regulator [Flavobacteriaceae bacterium]